VNGVFANGFSEFCADGASCGVGWVGCAHNFAVFRDRAFAFKNLNDNRFGCHEFAQFVIERTLGVYGIEDARLCLCHVNTLLCDDAQAGFFEFGVDFAGQLRRVASGLMIENVRSRAMIALLGGVDLAAP